MEAALGRQVSTLGQARRALTVTAAVETQLEVRLLKQGGVIPTILREQLAAHANEATV